MTAPAPLAAAPAAGWREERRRDRLAAAQIDLDREAARAELRITGMKAAAQARHEDRHARAVARQQARKARAARRAARLAWVREHAVDLLFVPVIAVPGLLAWTAMAAYGRQVYGPAGLALPAFSEGAMWAFAAATTLARRRDPDRPLWHLRAGTVLFAGYGAALNFAHGLTPGPALHGPAVAVVMALVSVAGVLTHQLVTAGPRRTRAGRTAARMRRAVARREAAARRAALRQATVIVDQHGSARLVCVPGPATLTRTRAGRTRLTPLPDRAPWPLPAPVLPAVLPAPAPGTAPRAVLRSAPAPRRTRTRSAPRTRTPDAVTAESAEVHFAADLAEGRVPSARRIKTELHVGQARATQIHDHLAAITGQHVPELSGRTA